LKILGWQRRSEWTSIFGVLFAELFNMTVSSF